MNEHWSAWTRSRKVVATLKYNYVILWEILYYTFIDLYLIIQWVLNFSSPNPMTPEQVRKPLASNTMHILAKMQLILRSREAVTIIMALVSVYCRLPGSKSTHVGHQDEKMCSTYSVTSWREVIWVTANFCPHNNHKRLSLQHSW